MTSTLQERFKSVAKKVRVDFEESAHTKHHGSRGTEREEIVAKFLELYVPGTVEVVHNAEIIAVNGEVSKQCDIILADRNAPRLRDIESHRIIPAECVFGVIEVKTRLDGRELKDACDKIAEAKKLPRRAYVRQPNPQSVLPIFGFVFAFDSIQPKTLHGRLLKWCTDNPRNVHPDAAWVADGSMLVWGPRISPPGTERPAIWHPAIDDPRTDRELLLLESTEEGDVLLGMITAIGQRLSRPLPLLDLADYLADGLVYRLSARSSLQRPSKELMATEP
jgi:hypothetical protein